MTARDRIVDRARFYADECHAIMVAAEEARRSPTKGAAASAAAARAYERRLAAAGMMLAQSLGLLMAVQIMEGNS